MALFSERYGYIKPSEVLIRECMPEEIVNAINSAYDILQNVLLIWIDITRLMNVIKTWNSLCGHGS